MILTNHEHLRGREREEESERDACIKKGVREVSFRVEREKARDRESIAKAPRKCG